MSLRNRWKGECGNVSPFVLNKEKPGFNETKKGIITGVQKTIGWSV